MTNWIAFLRRNARLGLIGGIVSVYLAAVGMVLAFSERNVIVLSDDGLALTLGRVMLALPPIGIGYFAARSGGRNPNPTGRRADGRIRDRPGPGRRAADRQRSVASRSATS